MMGAGEKTLQLKKQHSKYDEALSCDVCGHDGHLAKEGHSDKSPFNAVV